MWVLCSILAVPQAALFMRYAWNLLEPVFQVRAPNDPITSGISIDFTFHGCSSSQKADSLLLCITFHLSTSLFTD